MRKEPISVLIVEEHPETLQFWRGLFEGHGFAVLTAQDGASAWRLLQSRWPAIRAVLIGDLMQPPLDGLDLIRRLRHLPVVVATSYGPDYMLLARLAGAAIVLRKFGEVDHLVKALRRALLRPREVPRMVCVPVRRARR